MKPLRLGLAIGVTWGLVMFVVTLISVGTGYATVFLKVIQSIYLGYDVTVSGSIIGLIYGFIDGWIAGLLIGWFYNLFGGKES